MSAADAKPGASPPAAAPARAPIPAPGPAPGPASISAPISAPILGRRDAASVARLGPLFSAPSTYGRGLGPLPVRTGAPPPVQIEGIVSRVVFASEDGEFAVLQIDASALPVPAGDPVAAALRGPITAVGQLGGILKGETLRISGTWETHAQYGRRLRVEQALPIGPQTRLGMERYLETLSGIGPELARRIVDQHGTESLDVLENETWRIAQIKGVGKRRAQRALIDARSRREEREVMVFLQGLGISAAYAARIRKKYGQDAIRQVRANPYALARDVAGIGFHIADRIAQSVGIDLRSPLRAAAALRHVLDTAGDSGHCFLPAPVLFERAALLLRTSEPGEPGAEAPSPSRTPLAADEDLGPLLSQALTDLIAQKAALIDREQLTDETTTVPGPRVYLTRMYQAEVDLATLLVRLSQAVRARVPPIRMSLGGGVRLSPGQQTALRLVESGPLCVITGGPGTGKTTIIRALVDSWVAAGLRVKLAAPTGRAAKRLSEATGQTASTVHRMLALTPGEDTGAREDRSLAADLLVCDEASMLDLHLSLSLLRAIPLGATVVFVGDVDQLPSVGPGRVLADLIDSGRLPVARLRDIFRQQEGSGIVENAHRILSGELPLPTSSAPPPKSGGPGVSPLGDFYWIDAEDPVRARELVVRLCTERIPQRFGFDPRTEIQVLTPMHRGEVGTEELNRALQQAINPPPEGPDAAVLKSRGRSFSVGDKVMQVKNDYERDVWNGDVGRITRIDTEDGALRVSFDEEREAQYEGDTLDQLELAYAVSVHKSQGSEYKAVVVPLLGQHYPLLRRNLLYTAVTRGKKLVVLVGSRRALRRAVTEAGDQARYTRLAARLRHILPS